MTKTPNPVPMPTSVVLGPFTYRVSDDPADWQAHAVKPDDEWGHIDHMTGTILIAPGMTPAGQRSTLLHEILHACAHVAGKTAEKKLGEERWVCLTTTPLLDCLSRSEGLAEWLFGT